MAYQKGLSRHPFSAGSDPYLHDIPLHGVSKGWTVRNTRLSSEDTPVARQTLSSASKTEWQDIKRKTPTMFDLLQHCPGKDTDEPLSGISKGWKSRSCLILPSALIPVSTELPEASAHTAFRTHSTTLRRAQSAPRRGGNLSSFNGPGPHDAPTLTQSIGWRSGSMGVCRRPGTGAFGAKLQR